MKFKVGDGVRYRPGTGTYGYDDMLAADGRIAGEVVGFSATRVRVRLWSDRTARTVTRAVDAASLQKAEE